MYIKFCSLAGSHDFSYQIIVLSFCTNSAKDFGVIIMVHAFIDIYSLKSLQRHSSYSNYLAVTGRMYYSNASIAGLHAPISRLQK